jgi:hypothetical protein
MKEPWWAKHIQYKSDSLAEMISKEPEKFLISRTEILQLVLDFNTLKNKFTNLCRMQDAHDEWDTLPEEEKEKLRAEMKRFKEEFKKLWDQ